MSDKKKRVLILMGSANDLETVKPAAVVLRELEVDVEVAVASAHRTPDRAAELAASARKNGFGAIIAGAGLAHHLGGAVAARTSLPVIALPIAAGALQGLDALLSAVQMPPGVPVATVAIGGAKNAGLLAAQILAVADEPLAAKLDELKIKQSQAVEQANQKVQDALS